MKVTRRKKRRSSHTFIPNLKVHRDLRFYMISHRRIGKSRLLNAIFRQEINQKFDPINRELSTQESAAILNVSHNYLLKLLETGEIPSQKRQNDHIMLYQDLMLYKNTIDAKRRESLLELANQAQELNMGY